MMVYLNGEFLPIDEAKISPFDRGFLFGDGAYELIPVYARQAFRLDEHLARLENSLHALRLPNPHSREAWRSLIQSVIAQHEAEDQSVYLQITRGADALFKRDHAFPAQSKPTVFAFSSALITPSATQRAQGVAAITATDTRWLRCDLKTTSLLANVLLRQDAVEQHCAETILLRDGLLTEGAASTILLVKNGVLLAPPKDQRVLPGVTYDVVLELAAQHAMPYQVRDIQAAELETADELWMCSSTREILPITRLDGQAVGSGKPGIWAEQMYSWYALFRDGVMRKPVPTQRREV
ncbi:MAG: D-amino acid aminotransferase [Pseudomonadota bacterium]